MHIISQKIGNIWNRKSIEGEGDKNNGTVSAWNLCVSETSSKQNLQHEILKLWIFLGGNDTENKPLDSRNYFSSIP